MKTLIRRLFGAVVVVVLTAFVPLAHAAIVTIDFDDPGLVNLYFPGDTFSQSGFRMTVDFDFGTVDTAAALGTLAPSGNATQFYFNSNDGGLIVERQTPSPFSLLGFSAAFVPLNPPSGQTTAIVALGTTFTNAQVATAFLFAPPVSGIYPFGTYSNPLDFASFTNLQSVEFFACAVVSGQVCTVATQNNGQFALDNVRVAFAPEPSSVALMAVALLAVGAGLRRKTH